jgi:predicted DNA binding CopG/RHH family protein
MERKPGRPPLVPGESSTSVNVRLPNSQFDRLDKQAREEGVSVPTIVRRQIEKK